MHVYPINRSYYALAKSWSTGEQSVGDWINNHTNNDNANINNVRICTGYSSKARALLKCLEFWPCIDSKQKFIHTNMQIKL